MAILRSHVDGLSLQSYTNVKFESVEDLLVEVQEFKVEHHSREPA